MMKTKQILHNAANQLEQAGCHSLHERSISFLNAYDSKLRDDPVSAIESAYSLICEIRASLEQNGMNLENPTPEPSSRFFPLLFNLYFTLLQSPDNPHSLCCCKEVISLLTDLLSQLSTRRYLCVFVKDTHFVPKTRLSPLFTDPELQSCLQRLTYFLQFENDSTTGAVYTRDEQNRFYYKKMLIFQNILFK